MEQANVICLKFSFISLVDTASLLKLPSYYNSCKIACWRCVSPQGANNLDCQLPHRAVQIIGGTPVHTCWGLQLQAPVSGPDCIFPVDVVTIELSFNIFTVLIFSPDYHSYGPALRP